MKISFFTLIAFLIVSSPDIFATSFDCEKASTSSELLICSNRRLGSYDENLSAVYKSVMSTFSGQKSLEIKKEQISWIKKRDDACKDEKSCISAYKQRTAELRKLLWSGSDLESFSIDRQSCRATKDQEILIKCIKLNIYDPCDDAGGKWGAAQCGWAHNIIAERRIDALDAEIIEKLSKAADGNELIERFKSTSAVWRSYRDSHCALINEMDGLENFSSYRLHMAFCKRRLSEMRVIELEKIYASSE
ncbi:lysozyme inhibitor LprI family protein [Microbulbifer sp. MLAF003]|uniref:lysozyme inhibitor LprI family protein n=1 Tax=Microbulbifer sp. MLAF003 TaxID=3032582 RepID=UPI0024AE442E|nr:lysozyme inhibitor LprI family protein [Microbulbifer sp. MLAF003]WHI52945.1 lysozyme inhibitor LprI family protein [Microbulbifer sp. MLAF003]